MRPNTVLLWLALLLAVSLVPGTAAAQESGFSPDGIVFPVVGDVSYTDTFGAPRSGGRTHEAVDILADKVQPVVAADDGVVRWIGSTCCYLAIDHGGGWETWYIHLNNDTEGTDDGLGYGIADGIAVGVPVAQGQLIGWVGDSGNAESTVSHLHFEIRKDGTALNPYPYVVKAPVLEAPGTDPVEKTEDFFIDDDVSEHQANIDTMFRLGITKGCNPPANDRYCPNDWLTRGQVAAFLRRNLSLPSVEADFFTDDATSEFQDDINALTAAGIGFGCTATEFCVSEPLLRAEMAEFLVRAYGYDNPDAVDFFTDDAGNSHESAINALGNAGITKGCNPPDNTEFCPDSPLTRAEMATFLARALGVGA